MKRILLILLFSFAIIQIQAQVTPIYFKGEKTTTNKNEATSYAIYGKLSTEELWVFKRYDLWDNLIQTGSYSDDQLTTPHGKFTFYMDLASFNESHLTAYRLKGKTRFKSQEGTFVNGLEHGRWLLFYPDGNLLNVQDFVNGKAHGDFITFDKYGKIVIRGIYTDGEREGEWLFESGAKKVIYEKGVAKSSTNVEKQKKEKKTPDKTS